MKGCVDDDVFKIIPCLTHIDRAEMYNRGKTYP